MEAPSPLTCISEASRIYSVDRKTIRDLLRVHRISTHKIPIHGGAKGIDKDGMDKLSMMLNPSREKIPQEV